MNSREPGEAVVFLAAVHPTPAARAVRCLAPSAEPRTLGRQRFDIQCAIDLASGKTATTEVESVDANSKIRRPEAVEATDSIIAKSHAFLDNARYHHAALVQEGLAQPRHRISLRFIPSCCPQLNLIKRLWELMHTHLTHNKGSRGCPAFAKAAPHLLS